MVDSGKIGTKYAEDGVYVILICIYGWNGRVRVDLNGLYWNFDSFFNENGRNLPSILFEELVLVLKYTNTLMP